MKFLKHPKHLLAIACLSASGISAPVVAQDDVQLEEVIVTGSRGRPRSVSDSPVPIDVFTSEDLRAVSYTDTNDILKTLVPSFNLGRQPISDGSSFIRPAELRGLPTDKTLVLVNSKRRHRSALVSIGGSGTQGPDLSTIPSIALKNIEVLRDGASAQYGSDAIAGVINFILKDADDGFSLSIDSGGFSEGDGDQTTVQANLGLPLGDSGFINLSAEISEADATSRSEQYCESWFCAD
ncbi:MAG: TonB-dependent receptor plug domain-containing protein, partial [Gammaproteobacteria bacterium]|nr:TonB-dependent receptor plug domain-containing protein [Gammaproteobacteria bacterium]